MSQQTSQNVPCSLYCPYSVSTVAFFSLFRTRYGFFILVFLLVAIIYSILNVSLISSFWIGDVDFREELIPLESGNFWVNRDNDKGLIDPDSLDGLQDKTLLSYRSLELQQECNNFFTVWPGDCIDKFIQLDSRIRTLSALMVVMNSTLFFYTTDNRGCAFSSYPGIRVKRFNATDLLLSHGFVKALPIINSWDKSRFTRISDVLRICLALTYKLSYLDTDVHFLQPNKEWFLRSYVGAQVWSESKNSLEITNAAFCLPEGVLKDMLAFQLQRILYGSNTYFYTELGPSMFQHVLLNRRAIALYSQNHPVESSLKKIALEIRRYGHKQLHLTGHIRKGHVGLSFDQLVNNIRRKAGLPQLIIEAPMFYQGFDQATIGVGNTKIMKKDMNVVEYRMKSAHHTEEGIQGGGVQFNHGKSRVATDTYDKNGMDTFNNDKNSIQAVSHEQSSYWNGLASVLVKEESTTNAANNSTSTTRGTSSSKEKIDTQFNNPTTN